MDRITSWVICFVALIMGLLAGVFHPTNPPFLLFWAFLGFTILKWLFEMFFGKKGIAKLDGEAYSKGYRHVCESCSRYFKTSAEIKKHEKICKE